MIDSKLSALILSVLTVPVLILSIACGGEDAGPSRAEVEEIVRAGLAESPAPSTAEPGLTSADVEKAIRTAIVDMPQPEPGLSQEEVERIVEAAIASIPDPKSGLTSDEAEKIARGVVASIPPKSAPAEYTRFFVNNAISSPNARSNAPISLLKRCVQMPTRECGKRTLCSLLWGL